MTQPWRSRAGLVFLIAGAVGLAVDAGLLALLLAETGLGPFTSRPIAILLAMTATWAINRHFGFGPSRRHIAGEWLAYVTVGSGSAVFNYAVYTVCLLAIPGLPPLLALAVASLAAMTLSWIGYSRWVFAAGR